MNAKILNKNSFIYNNSLTTTNWTQPNRKSSQKNTQMNTIFGIFLKKYYIWYFLKKITPLRNKIRVALIKAITNFKFNVVLHIIIIENVPLIFLELVRPVPLSQL